LELYVIGHAYEIPQFVEQSEDAVVNAYEAFLTDYAAEFVRTSKTSSPWTILGNLAERWAAKIVQSEESAKQGAITELNMQRESELKEQYDGFVSEKAWWKKHALELNQSIRRYDEAFRYLWANTSASVCTFHANILLI
jgi:hypothetical protein